MKRHRPLRSGGTARRFAQGQPADQAGNRGALRAAATLRTQDPGSLPTTVLMALAFLASAIAAEAQLTGHNTKGDFGLAAGTQAPPGYYVVAPLYLRYDADTLRDRHGDRTRAQPDLGVNAYVFGFLHVSEKKLLGANYSFQIFPAFTDNSLEAPALDIAQSVGTGLTDLYAVPLNLGWHRERTDFVAGMGLFAPIGRYEPGADENLGLGMWSFEFYGGATVYLDEAKSWNLATTAFYETHTEKKDTDVRVGDILTLEGGLGKSFLGGTINVGVAYYAQWKVTRDDFGLDLEPPSGRRLGRHRVFGVGPEVTLPLASKEKLFGFLTARYFWETGARSALEGSSFLLSATFPIPSVPLQ